MTTVTETFFLPKEIERKQWLLPADIYNLYYSLQQRNEIGHVFVSIRTLWFMNVALIFS